MSCSCRCAITPEGSISLNGNNVVSGGSKSVIRSFEEAG